MCKQAKIYLVEDEVLSAFYMVSLLKRMGFMVNTTLTTGEDTVICVAKDAPDLILMDINLAGAMNGIEAVRRIKERKDVPVIFITGYSDDEIRAQADAVNPVAFLVKPVDVKELEKWIKIALAGYKPA